MLLNNKASHILTVTNIVAGGTVVIKAGVNEIPDAIWGQVRAQLTDKINAGSLVEIGVKVEKEDKPAPVMNIKDVTTDSYKVIQSQKLSDIKDPAAACKLVAQTFDKELLLQWRDGESRDSVRIEISKQIDSIETGKPRTDIKE